MSSYFYSLLVISVILVESLLCTKNIRALENRRRYSLSSLGNCKEIVGYYIIHIILKVV